MDSPEERREGDEEKKNLLERKIFEEIMTDISHIWAKNVNEAKHKKHEESDTISNHNQSVQNQR